MSLIFSALSEIDRQARGGPHDPAQMQAVPDRGWSMRRMMVPAVLLLAVAVGAWLLWRPATPAADDTAGAQAALPAAAPAPVVSAQPRVGENKPAAPLDRVASGQAASPLPTTVPVSQDDRQGAGNPPYAPVDEPLATPAVAAGNRQVRIVSRAGSAATQAPRTDTPATTAGAVSDANEDLATKDAGSADASPAATRPASIPAPPKAIPEAAAAQSRLASTAESAEDDAPMIGSDNFIRVGRQPQPAADQDVSRLVATFRAAMARADHTSAKAALDQMGAALSPRSLTLLRMQAWYAVDSGDDAGARERYSRLLQRLPDDINAGVNVALIDWRAGRQAQALQRINEMYTQHPDSELVKRNWQVMHQQRQ